MRGYYLTSSSWFRFLDLCDPAVGLDFQTCVSLGSETFFLEYTFVVIQFLGACLIDDDSDSRKEDRDTGVDTLGGLMRKISIKWES